MSEDTVTVRIGGVVLESVGFRRVLDPGTGGYSYIPTYTHHESDQSEKIQQAIYKELYEHLMSDESLDKARAHFFLAMVLDAITPREDDPTKEELHRLRASARKLVNPSKGAFMKLYILKHSKVLNGFYTSIMCCVAGSKEEAIVDLLDNASKYFDACIKENCGFHWSGESAFLGDTEEELAEVATIKLQFLNALKKELEADLFETDKPYIEVSS